MSTTKRTWMDWVKATLPKYGIPAGKISGGLQLNPQTAKMLNAHAAFEFNKVIAVSAPITVNGFIANLERQIGKEPPFSSSIAN